MGSFVIRVLKEQFPGEQFEADIAKNADQIWGVLYS